MLRRPCAYINHNGRQKGNGQILVSAVDDDAGFGLSDDCGKRNKARAMSWQPGAQGTRGRWPLRPATRVLEVQPFVSSS